MSSLLTQVRGFVFLFFKPFRSSSSVKPLTPYIYNPFKRYSQASREHSRGHEVEERAPSTAEEFRRVAEEKEKLRAADQGVARKTSEKLYDAAEEATIGDDSKVDSIKKRVKEHEEGADYHKRGDQ